jgi:hypothetical protein
MLHYDKPIRFPLSREMIMIKFFRIIRQKMLVENKFSKYLLYAIGEIVLVVFGILIALQINNWNQKNKSEPLANVYLIDFKHDIETDIASLEKRISKNKAVSKTIDSIFFTLATKNKLSDVELMHFYNQHISLNSESYFIPEKITLRQFEGSNNTQLTSSKTLKVKLFKYYSENDRNEMNGEKSMQLYQHLFFSKEIIQPLLSGNILYNIGGSTFGRANLDLNELRMNSDYIWSLGGKKTNNDNQTSKYEYIKALAEDLIETIDSEFESQQ